MQNSYQLKDRPKANLRTKLEITFHTAYAVNLIEGTNTKNNPHKFFIVGLLGFASKLKTIKNEADRKNPYAKYYYAQAERKLDKAKNFINKTFEHCIKIFDDAENVGISLSIPENDTPVTRQFTFKVELCYQAVILLAKYDTCIRKLQAAKQTGFVTSNFSDNTIDKMSKLMRQLFQSLEPYKNHSVTIEDIQVGNKKAWDAYNAMGIIPGINLDTLIYTN